MDMQRRAQIAQNILDMTAGVEFETALAAQCDALATSIGGTFFLSGHSCAEAEALVRELANDMAATHIRKHWGTIEADDHGKEGGA